MYSVASTPRLVIHISISTQVTILILVELKMVVYGYILYVNAYPITYDHRTLKTRLPVRSGIYKQCTGGLVVWAGYLSMGLASLVLVFGSASRGH